MSDINYKMKYQSLKMKFMSSVDMAFRLGYEQGMKDSQVQQAADAQQQAAEAEMNAQPGQPGEENPAGQPGAEAAPNEEVPSDASAGAPMQESEHPEGSELDQHINMLESMLSKGEELSSEELKKALHEVRSFKQAIAIKRNNKAIKKIAKAVNAPRKPFIMSKSATQNLSTSAKGALNMQEKIVGDIMKSWEQEEQKAGKSILETLNIEGLTKKE